MRQDRFDNIIKYLHFHPNYNLYKDDKYCKLRPLVTHLQQKFISHFVQGVQILGLMVCIIMFRQLPMIPKEDVLENYANLKAEMNAVNEM